MSIPVACSLSAQDAATRVEEWRRFFERSIDAADQVGPLRLRVHLDPMPETLIAAVDLALREKSCCNFFDFSIELQLDGRWLVIAVPQDAAGVLAEFSRLLPPGMSTENRGR